MKNMEKWTEVRAIHCNVMPQLLQCHPIVLGFIVVFLLSVTTFVIACLTYDTQLYYTPVNFVRDHHAVPVRPVYENSKTFREAHIKKILLLPYHRGGSSFLGELFGENLDVFYWYEPLRNMYREFPSRLRTHIDIVEHLYDITSEGNMTSLPRPLLNTILNTTHAVLTCDVLHVDKHVLSEEFMLRWVHMPRVRAYAECMIFHIDDILGPRMCTEILHLTCLQSEAIVAKILRFPVYLLKELLQRESDLKVLYYVRDPRAILLSRADRFGQTQQEMVEKAKLFCPQLREDYNHYLKILETFPNNIMLIHYEQLAREPVETAREIYKFVNMTFLPSLEEWILVNTRSSKADGRIGTQRNSSATASRWRHTMQPEIATEITTICKDVLELHGYYP